jgi:hypothetical protein
VFVRLSDLSDLPRPGSPGADLDGFVAACRLRGVDRPADVVQQFLFDHGTNDEFIEQYGHLDLRAIHWSLEAMPAAELIGATCYLDFVEHVESVASHPRWTVDQYRLGHGDVWTSTWVVAPLMMRGELLSPPHGGLHLVEGHTRIGVLKGMVGLGEISVDSLHEVHIAR